MAKEQAKEVIETLIEKFQVQIDFYKSPNKIDNYQLFIENSINLLKIGGYLAYITPNTFLKNIHSEPLRKFILEHTTIEEFLLFYYNVFEQASVDVCVSLIKRSEPDSQHMIQVKEVREVFNPKLVREITQNSFQENHRFSFNISINKDEKIVIDKIIRQSSPLYNHCKAYFGIQTWDRKKYVANTKINDTYQPIIDGSNINRYILKPVEEYVLFSPESIKSGGNQKIYLQERLCTRQISTYPVFTVVQGGIFALNTVYNIYTEQETTNLKFILGILNSKAIQYYWKKVNFDEKKTFPKIKKEALLNIPIPLIDTENKENEKLYEKLSKLVEAIRVLNQRQQQTKLLTEKQTL